MRESGKVVAIQTDSVWVETSRQTACGSCSAQKGCGTSLLAKLFPNRQHHVRVLGQPAQLSAVAIGDEISLEVSDGLIVKASIFMYLLPIVALLFGASVGDEYGRSDGFAVLGAAPGLAFGLAVVRIYSWRGRNNPSLQPRIVDIGVNTNRAHAGSANPDKQILELT